MALLTNFDLNGVIAFWTYLDTRFFSRLGDSLVSGVRKLELCMKRYFVVHALQNQRMDKVAEFFERFAPELQLQSEWLEWFGACEKYVCV